MPSITAKRQCPDIIFVKSRFEVYNAISHQIREIFAEHTPIIEPLSPGDDALAAALVDLSQGLQGADRCCRTELFAELAAGGLLRILRRPDLAFRHRPGAVVLV